MKVFYNKGHMITYYQFKKLEKKWGWLKNQVKVVKNEKNWSKLVLCAFRNPKIRRKYKTRVFQNKRQMISSYQLKKIG